MPRLRSLLLPWLAILTVCLPRAGAQSARGITVGAPKAFDNRTLNLMLERLNGQLAGINVIDQKSLAQAIGTVQGSSAQETSRSLSIQGPQQSSSPKDGGAPPSLPDLLATPSALTSLKYGMNSSDLLSEQVELSYQIFNLQMLLDRSLSDRLLNPKFGPRLQTVVGLNVSVDPPRDAENAAAIVEITLTKTDDPCQKTGTCDESTSCTPGASAVESPSLVAAMPQEHSYNSVALSSKSNAFGGSAVTKLITVGYNERRRGQTYYMFRDNDTISFERQSCPGAGRVTFGWAFRPVLGRKSVSPGLRQLFAVVALPEDDSYRAHSDKDSSGEAQSSPPTYAIAIKTYWRKYDPRTLTSANDSEIRPWSKVGHFLSLGTNLTYAPSGVTKISNYQLVVPLTSTYLYQLRPSFQSISWHPVGTKQASIAVEGQNLFYDTQVAIGDKLLSGPKEGLRLVSDQGMDIVTDLSALYGDVAILGRYGPAKPLELEIPDRTDLTLPAATFGAALGGYISLTVLPMSNHGKQCLEMSDLADARLGQPILFLNGAPIPGPYSFSSSDDCLSLVARVPESAMPKLGGSVTLKFPFRKGLSAKQILYDPTTVYKLQTLTPDKDYLLRRLDGAFVREQSGITVNKVTVDNWRLVIGTDPPIPLTYPCPETVLKKTNTFCLMTPNDNLARVLVGKTYPCSDTPATDAVPIPSAANKNIAGSPKGQAAAAKKNGNGKPKSCGPKTFLLQSAITRKDGLYWAGTYPLTLSSGTTDSSSSDQSDSNSSKPALDANQSQTVHQHDLVWRSFNGKSLAAVGAVTAGETRLAMNPAKDGKSIAVLIPNWATAYPAEVDLTFRDKQDLPIGTAKCIVKSNPSGASK